MNRSIARWVLLSLVVLSFSLASFGQIAVGISVHVGPPALPVYAQPICPGPGYVWTPGYWGWNDDDGYYWVPGTWVVAPVGLLWTPGYWGWGGGVYAWHAGYWGPHVGFYGGINYGFGYGGVGFGGGEWRGRSFYYNRTVTNISSTTVTNVYNKTVIVNENHTAFNGGEGGVKAHATAQEEAYGKEKHTAALSSQNEHEHAASQNKQNFASANHGKPAIAATSKPGDFSAHSAVPARSAGGEYHAPKMSPKEARATPSNNGNKGAASNKATANNKMASNKANTGGNKSNAGSRSFNPPKNNATPKTSTASNQHNNNSNHNSSNRVNQSRPQTQAHNSQPKESPRPQAHHSSPPPAPHRSSPPPTPHHGKGR